MANTVANAVMEPLPKISVLGLPIHLCKDYVAEARQRLQHRRGTHVVTLNAEMVMQARQNSELARAILQADLCIPDGSGVVLFLRSQGYAAKRCPGIEFAESLVRESAGDGLQVFLLGGAPGIGQTVADQWQQRWPELQVAGVEHGYFDAAAETVLCERLQHSQPDLILVGLGVPRQELWIEKYRHLCPQSTWVGVGGSFDIWSGSKTRAPEWLRDNHLEWVYRLYQEPWRWRRMLALPHFVWCAAWSSVRQTRIKR